MNDDESTQALSDKVLDRGNVMQFAAPAEFVKPAKGSSASINQHHRSFGEWRRWIRPVETLVAGERDKAQSIIGNLVLIMENFGRPAKLVVDPKTNEAYVADGYLNTRVVVMDADTGKFKRFWGAYGNKPDDSVFEKASVTGDQSATGYDPAAAPAQQFRHAVHCVMVSRDDLVYVCDRQGDRIQVFTKSGKFVKEAWVAKETRDAGSVWDLAFSADPAQSYLYVGDGENERIHILRRDTLEELTSFGDGGRQPGMFYGVHVIASDSKGNLYTGETYEGHRVQRFVYKGMGTTNKKYQGVLWPSSAK